MVANDFEYLRICANLYKWLRIVVKFVRMAANGCKSVRMAVKFVRMAANECGICENDCE